MRELFVCEGYYYEKEQHVRLARLLLKVDDREIGDHTGVMNITESTGKYGFSLIFQFINTHKYRFVTHPITEICVLVGADRSSSLLESMSYNKGEYHYSKNSSQ